METIKTTAECKTFIRPVRDVIELLGGKWKLPIFVALSLGTKRFKDLQADLAGITPRTLTKELRDLEANKLVSRTVHDSSPPVVEYSLTPYGKSLNEVIASIRHWGIKHRKTIFQKPD